MRACWLKWVGRDWSISADYIWLNYSGANNGMQLQRQHHPETNIKGCINRFRLPNKMTARPARPTHVLTR